MNSVKNPKSKSTSGLILRQVCSNTLEVRVSVLAKSQQVQVLPSSSRTVIRTRLSITRPWCTQSLINGCPVKQTTIAHRLTLKCGSNHSTVTLILVVSFHNRVFNFHQHFKAYSHPRRTTNLIHRYLPASSLRSSKQTFLKRRKTAVSCQ